MTDVLFNTYVFETEYSRYWRSEFRGRDQAESVALTAVRASLVRGALHYVRATDLSLPLVWDDLLRRLEAPAQWSPDEDPLEVQRRVFKDAGIFLEGDFRLVVPAESGAIVFTIEPLEGLAGSFFRRFRVSIDLKEVRKYLREVSIAVISGLVVVAGTPYIEHRVEPRPAPYVCSINATIPASRDQALADAAEALKMPPGASPETQREVIRSRQLCLDQAGFSPGPHDGVEGAKTIEAAREFAHFHGQINVNWQSPVFRRFVAEQAMKHRPPHG